MNHRQHPGGSFAAALLMTLALAWAAFPAPTPAAPTSIPGHECDPLPVGDLSDEDLRRLVPDGSPGRVRVRWATESQDNVFGFNVMRATTEGGPFQKINRSVVPGEGTTNMPMAYCYLDTSAERGKTYWYYIEEVTLDGQRNAIAETKGKDGKGTRVTVRQVDEERKWLRDRALQAAKGDEPTTGPKAADNPTTAPAGAASSPPRAKETRQVGASIQPRNQRPAPGSPQAKALGAVFQRPQETGEPIDPLE